MNELRWRWSLAIITFTPILVSVTRGGDAAWLSGFAILLGGVYTAVALAGRRGLKWRRLRNAGLIMLGEMIIVLLFAFTIGAPFEPSMLMAVACPALTLLAATRRSGPFVARLRQPALELPPELLSRHMSSGAVRAETAAVSGGAEHGPESDDDDRAALYERVSSG